MGYTILFSYYEIVGEEARLIDEYRLPSSQQKESLETLLRQQIMNSLGTLICGEYARTNL